VSHDIAGARSAAALRSPQDGVEAIGLPVAFERCTVGVELEAVELDDHPVTGEQRVDLAAAGAVVDQRLRQVVVSCELQERVLELRPRRRAAFVRTV
jgi:hypothetical protein